MYMKTNKLFRIQTNKQSIKYSNKHINKHSNKQETNKQTYHFMVIKCRKGCLNQEGIRGDPMPMLIYPQASTGGSKMVLPKRNFHLDREGRAPGFVRTYFL